MIIIIINKILELYHRRIIVIIGNDGDKIRDCINNNIEPIHLSCITYVVQKEPLGTGDAVKSTRGLYAIDKEKGETMRDKEKDDVGLVILPADLPLIKINTLEALINNYNNNCVILVLKTKNPTGYGRIIRQGKKIKIIEEKDCNEEEKKITLVNGGVYVINSRVLFPALDKITNNNQANEYYLTDIFNYIDDINEVIVEDDVELINVNRPVDLQLAQEKCN